MGGIKMQLYGAKIRNIYYLCAGMQSEDHSSLPLKVKVPHYQRPFKWGEEKIELLINDFFNNYNNVINRGLADDNEKKYFAGSIVTVKRKGTDKYDDLIDGQQRITTVFLTNYVKFLLLRSYINVLISLKKVYL